MPYNKTKWVDKVVENPRNYTEIINQDGTVTHNPAPGEVVNVGTPVNATNLNKMEEAIQHTCIAMDFMYTILQALVRNSTTQQEKAVMDDHIRGAEVSLHLLHTINQAQDREIVELGEKVDAIAEE